ncbi:MAG: LPS export ABC transporter periplasmic protein LptC [Muribaculaceae bacterium]|nr:LPS export ABC transporter periplasmic protein LptC [Muribaculaceae bacterium]
MKFILLDRKMRVAAALGVVAAGFVVNIGVQAYAQQQRKKEVGKKEESYSRPKPTRPIRPEIPGANRYRDDKVFLEYADSLFKIDTRDTVERQIVKGNVKFRQAGMWMYCDSAYYYPNLNSLDAFGHVRMEQGDTLFVYADKLYYEGNEKLARLKNGPSYAKVRLVNRDVTLTTDSLDYSLAMELGWYEKWGTIDDKVNTLTSLYGEYSPGTKNADFYKDVVLVNNEDGYTLLTDTLHYNTATHIARIESETAIQGANDTIITTRGVYDTQAGNAELLTRSMIIHRDSNNNVTTLEGDSIIYDKQNRISRAYMFRNPLKTGMPMVLTDTAHKTTLIGGFGIYNDSTREALATEYPMLMEYSQGDTLFLRADTIKTYIISELVAASRRWTASGFPEKDGIPVLRASDGIIWLDSMFFSLVAPLSELPVRLLSKVAPMQASSEKGNRPEMPRKPDPFKEMAHEKSLAVGDSADSIVLNERRATEMHEGIGTDSISGDSIPLVPKEFHIALAYHRARFFKQDLQGVADSMVVVERDSMMYMFRKPIVWSGERQVTGNRIDIHFNDSTADWALLPESGMLSEHVDEDFYNQLGGKKLLATFANQTLNTLDVSGNVEMIFLPQESDSTYNRLVAAESSYLTLEMDSGRMSRLKMWPEVSGTVTPLFLVKKQQQYLRQFRWWESLRPVREWYGDRWHWQDNLGEVPEDLDRYFEAASDFGVPKSFPQFRPVSVPASGVTLTQLEESEAELEEENKETEEKSELIEKAVKKEETENEDENNKEQQ